MVAMRTFACLAILVSAFVVSAAEEKPVPLRLEATLTDGSHIKGEITPPYHPLDVSSPVVGKLSIPLPKIAGITLSANSTGTAIRLRNGDKLQGQLGIETIKMTTLFGPVSVPLSAIQQLDFRPGDRVSTGLGPDAWQAVPFPVNSDWPGYKGTPAEIGEAAVSLRGQPVRSRNAYPVPLTIECDVTLEKTPDRAGGFIIFFFPPGTPADAAPDQGRDFRLGFDDPVGEPIEAMPIIYELDESQREKELWRGDAFSLKSREIYRLKLEISATGWRVTINDKAYKAIKVGVPYEKVLIELWNWQPSTRWQVREFRIY